MVVRLLFVSLFLGFVPNVLAKDTIHVGILPSIFYEDTEGGPQYNGAAIRGYLSYLPWQVPFTRKISLGPFLQTDAVASTKFPLYMLGGALRFGAETFLELGVAYYRLNSDDNGIAGRVMIGQYWSMFFVAFQYTEYGFLGQGGTTIPSLYSPIFGLRF